MAGLGKNLATMLAENQKLKSDNKLFEKPTPGQKNLSELKIEIKFHLSQMAGHAIEIGKLLIEAKKQVNHGDWYNWLDVNFNLTAKMANNFMRVSERFSNRKSISDLGTTQMIAMLALPAGEEENFIAEKAAENNPVEDMTIKNLREEIKSYKEKLFQAEQERDGYKTASEISDGQLETANAENERLRQTLDKEGRRVGELIEDNLNLQADKQELQDKIDDLQNEILQKETVKVFPADYEITKNQLSEIKSENVKLQAEIKNLQEKPVEVAVEYSADYDNLKSEVAELKNRQKNLQENYAVTKKISEMFSAIPILTNYINLIEVVKDMAEKDSKFGEKIIQLGLIHRELANCFRIWKERNEKV